MLHTGNFVLKINLIIIIVYICAQRMKELKMSVWANFLNFQSLCFAQSS
jgi:hypothetical protein